MATRTVAGTRAVMVSGAVTVSPICAKTRAAPVTSTGSPVLAARRRLGPVLLLPLTLHVALVARRAVEQLVGLLAADPARRTRLRRRRLAGRALALRRRVLAAAAPATAPSALLLPQRQLVIPLRVAVGRAHEQRPLVDRERGVQLRLRRVAGHREPAPQVGEPLVEERPELLLLQLRAVGRTLAERAVHRLEGAVQRLHALRQRVGVHQRGPVVVGRLRRSVAGVDRLTIERRRARVLLRAERGVGRAVRRAACRAAAAAARAARRAGSAACARAPPPAPATACAAGRARRGSSPPCP